MPEPVLVTRLCRSHTHTHTHTCTHTQYKTGKPHCSNADAPVVISNCRFSRCDSERRVHRNSGWLQLLVYLESSQKQRADLSKDTHRCPSPRDSGFVGPWWSLGVGRARGPRASANGQPELRATVLFGSGVDGAGQALVRPAWGLLHLPRSVTIGHFLCQRAERSGLNTLGHC